MEILKMLVIVLLLCESQSYRLKKNETIEQALSKGCPLQRIMNRLGMNTKRTITVIKDLKFKLVKTIYANQTKSKNGCQPAAAYVDSMETFQQFEKTKRLDFSGKILTEYLETVNSVLEEVKNSSTMKPFVNEFNNLAARMTIDKYRIEIQRRKLIPLPCFGGGQTVTLWRRFSPVYPNANPAPCNRNKDDEILTIVQDIEFIYINMKNWFLKERKFAD